MLIIAYGNFEGAFVCVKKAVQIIELIKTWSRRNG